MKAQNLFSSIILIGIGLYFFLSQSDIINLFNGFYSWPTLLCIVGIAFLFQAFKAHVNEAILPGVILLGFGIHFHVTQSFNLWPNEFGVFLLIIAIGLFIQARKAKTSLWSSILLFVISVYLLFQPQFLNTTNILGDGFHQILSFWPFLLIGIGIILLLKKK
ncbi:MAG: LiaF transmembrane domain-containing protein [Bacillus sp. (in: firmicutes)]